MKSMEIKAPAKINIGLKILSKRDDGFHNLLTLFYPIKDLYDILIFEPSDTFEFQCDSEFVPRDESNIVVKARNLLTEVSGKNINVKISLKKNIPSQAGLGGGSSDAAATLKALNNMFQLKLTEQKLLDLGLELGSDVPFFINADPAIGESRGEILHKLDFKINEAIVIVNPGINISTKVAFQNISYNATRVEYSNFVNGGRLNYAKLRDKIRNDFEEYIFGKYSEIGALKSIMYNNGALFSLMSGSGSTVYGIFPNLDSAIKASQKIPPAYFVFISNPHD